MGALKSKYKGKGGGGKVYGEYLFDEDTPLRDMKGFISELTREI